MRTVAILLFTVIGIAACSRATDSALPQITAVNGGKATDVELQDLAESADYVALETTEDSFLGQITEARYADGRYFVCDNRYNLLAFDSVGHFVARIGNIGRADNEYTEISTFFIDRGRRLAGVVSGNLRRILYYGYNGEFSHSVTLAPEDADIRRIECLDSGKLLAFYSLPNDFNGGGAQYKLLTEHGAEMASQPLLPAPNFSTGDMGYSTIHEPMVFFDGQCLAAAAFSHDIHALRDQSLVPAFTVSSPRPVADEHLLKKYDRDIFSLQDAVRQNGGSMGITGLGTDGRYLFIALDRAGTVLWDGKNGFLLGRIYDAQRNATIFPGAGGFLGQGIGVISATELQAADLPAESPFRDIAAGIGANDNPVLCRYRFRENLVDLLVEKYN